MRLDKFLSQQLGISRSQVGRLVRSGRIAIDHEIVKDSACKLNPDASVTFDGATLQRQVGPRYFMLNKPQGYVCSTDDPSHPTILHFIDEPAAQLLHSAGRLDRDTTGLVLLTDDGQWSHRITSPRHHCEKIYLVTLDSPITEGVAEKFAAGIQLKGEKQLTKPALMQRLGETLVRLTISEGRYHQVKRMFAAVGNHVVALHRERIGEIVLDDRLAPGEYRPLTQHEIISVERNK